MAHIESLDIHDLLGRATPLSRALNRHLNVFFGLNGSGKTSILNILRVSLTRDGKHAQWVPFKHARVNIYSNDHVATFEHNIVRKNNDSVVAQRGRGIIGSPDPTVELSIKSDKSLKPGGWTHEFLPAHRIYEYGFRTSVQPPVSSSDFNPHSADVAFESAMSEQWLRIASSIQQRVSALQTEAMGKIIAALISSVSTVERTETTQSIDPQAAYERLMSFFGTQVTHPFSQTEFRTSFTGSRNLREVVSILEGLELQIGEARRPQSRLQEFLARLYSSGKSVTFLDNKIDVILADKSSIGVRSLSSGEKHILRLLLGAFRAGDSTFIIDEPELSLHVGWQEQLVHMLREMNPKAQVIMATHSPEIVRSAEELGGQIIDLDSI